MGVAMLAIAGTDIGIGHLARTRAIADELDALTDVAIIFQSPPELARPFVDGCSVAEIVVDRAEAVARLSELVLSHKTIATDGIGFDAKDNITFRSVGFSRLVHLTDDNIAGYRPDLAILTDASPDLSSVPPGMSVAAGPMFHPIRRKIREARGTTAASSDPEPNVLIILGGTDPGRCSERLLETSEESLTDYKVTLVLGPGIDRQRQRAIMANARHVDILRDPPNLPTLIARATLTITLGGLTSYEAMYLGSPVAVLPWEHMAEVAVRLGQAGLVSIIDRHSPATQIRRLLGDPLERDRLSRNGQVTIDGRGAARASQIIVGAGTATP